MAAETTQQEEFAVRIVKGDVPAALLDQLNSEIGPRVAIDIETSGLDFRHDKIGSIQVFDGRAVYIVRPPFTPRVLAEIAASDKIVKIFHHAMFDLRFLSYQLNFRPRNIKCTKIAAKIVLSEIEKSSLVDIVKHYFGRQLSKGQQTSNWLQDALSPDQVLYAMRDVIYLPRLMSLLLRDSEAKRLRPLVISSFQYIPTRVQLDILGSGDVFIY